MTYGYKKVSIQTDTHCGTYISIADRQTLIPELITTAFLASLTQSGFSIKTIEKHATTIVHFLNSVLESPSIENDWTSLKDQHLSAYQESRAYELSAGAYSIMISNLKKFFDWCYETGWIDKKLNYNWKLTYEKNKEISNYKSEVKSKDPFKLFSRYISQEDFNYLLSFNPRKSSFERERDEIILKLGYYSGFRRAEVVAPININLKKIKRSIRESSEKGLEGFNLTIIGKGKNGGKARIVYIPPSLKRQIENFIRNELKRSAPNSDLLICKIVNGCPKPLEEQHATTLFREAKLKLISEGEVELVKSWVVNYQTRTYHSLRHSYATNFADEIIYGDANLSLLQERMGHTYIETTKIYLWFSAKRHGDMNKANLYSEYLNNRHSKREMES